MLMYVKSYTTMLKKKEKKKEKKKRKKEAVTVFCHQREALFPLKCLPIVSLSLFVVLSSLGSGSRFDTADHLLGERSILLHFGAGLRKRRDGAERATG